MSPIFHVATRINVINISVRILSPIWTEKPETAKRLSQRISAVIRWARASEFFTGDDPVEAALAGLPRQKHDVQHHKALHFDHVPELIRKLRACSAKPESKLALEFLILTAARTKETLGARWNEVDFQKRLWVVPVDRMKPTETHRVPLTSHAMDLLKQVRALSPESEFVFPNQATGRPLSYNPRFPRWFLPTAENGSTIENRSKAWPFIPVWRLGLGHAAHPSPRQGTFGCAIMVIRQWASARPPPVQPRSDDTRRHVGAGFGRRPSISRRISANNRRGIATSASWNVT